MQKGTNHLPNDVRQAGATDIVSALHAVPIGEAWSRAAVAERKLEEGARKAREGWKEENRKQREKERERNP